MSSAEARSNGSLRSSEHLYRVAVIGGGVVGCAVLRAFALAGLNPVMLEKGPDILSGASKANSALLHTGYDGPVGSLEVACVRSGYDEYLWIRDRLNLPLLETSAVMVAWNEDDAARLPAIAEKSHANGVTDVHHISLEDLYRCEPNLARNAKAALAIPGEHVIDPWSAPLAYALQAIANGAEVRRNCRVSSGRLDDGVWSLQTTQGRVRAEVVVNCAGLYGDIVEAICRTSPFTITPRKGQFIVFDKPAARLVNATILAVPNERSKGVLLARTVFGNLLLGPSAEDQTDRARTAVDSGVLADLVECGTGILPAVANATITATFAGLRPATQYADYQIEAIAERRWITVGGIRSTGLTGSLGIARYVRTLYAEHFGPAEEIVEPRWVHVPNLCESRPRPYQSEAGGDIVCHCELVTRGEIDAALDGPLPARDLGGLRRRTRCMLGRCQGFYCASRIAELTAARFEPPLTERVTS